MSKQFYFNFHQLISGYLAMQGYRCKNYYDIDWMRLGSHTVLLNLNKSVQDMDKDIYHAIQNSDVASLKDEEIEKIKPLIHFFAKIQADEEFLKELLP